MNLSDESNIPTQHELHKLFVYDAKLGVLRHKYDDARLRIKANDIVGHAGDKYVRTKIQGKAYPVHTLIWLMHTGDWRLGELDHINRNGLDNRLENLRVVTKSVNQFNRDQKLGATAPMPGVRYKAGKWEVSAGTCYIGRFLTLLDAAAARFTALKTKGVTQ